MNADLSVELIALWLFTLLLMLVLGYLLAWLLHGRRKAELEQLKQALQTSEQQHAELNRQHHQLALTEAGLTGQLSARDQKIQELQQKAQETSAEIQSLRQMLAETNGQLSATERDKAGVEATLQALTERYAEVEKRLEAAQSRQQADQERIVGLESRLTRLKTEQDEREASHAREVANFERQKTSLSEQFKVLANEILDAKAKSLQENSHLTLNSVVTPFKQTIDSFKKEIQDIHHRETTQQGELRKELAQLKELNQKITAEAHELSTALRGQKKLQGNWGELVLENVLERSGLRLGQDYRREVSIDTDDGRLRPDAVVYLPQGKHLIIDAKVSLNAYTRFVNAEDDQVRALALKEHVKAVAGRIDELADRDYYKLPGLNSPEIVFMFIPIESAFVEAFRADETLFQTAIANNVLVATPTTLLTSLNIVRQLWRFEDQNKHTAALANKAEAVFKKLNAFLGSFENIKKNLDRATEAYGKAENQLISGKGNLVKQVGEFKKLAPAIKAELPEYFAEKAALEIDFLPSAEGREADEYGD